MRGNADLAELKRRFAVVDFSGAHGSVPFDAPALDTALAGGLARGALHEVFARTTADAPAASGFTLAMAMRMAGKKPLLWARQDFAGLETGGLHAPGIAEMGQDVSQVILVKGRDGPDVLRAGEEASRCAALGAVLIEIWGVQKSLDLTASRRLTLAAGRSGVPLFMLRAGAAPSASAAMTRWEASAAPSLPLPANAPGHPAFAVTLLRRRAGAAGQTWIVEWDRDRRTFKDITAEALSRRVVSVSSGGPVVEDDIRRAG